VRFAAPTVRGTTVSRGTQLCLGSALLLLVSTFFPWEERSVSVAGVEVLSHDETAWGDLPGVVLGVATIALVVWVALQLAGVGLATGPAGHAVPPVLAGVVLVVAIVKSLVNDHSTYASYVGVLAAMGVAAGAWLRAQAE
jgi:hypothetical protein